MMNRYKAIVVPDCRFMPVETAGKLLKLAGGGANILYMNGIARDVPGYFDLEGRRREMRVLLSDMSAEDSLHRNFGPGQIMVSDSVFEMLEYLEIQPEQLAKHKIGFIRRRFNGGRFYFLANQQSEPLDNWVRLAYPAKSVVFLDPLTGKTGIARTKTNADGTDSVYLQLEPGASLILKAADALCEGPQWTYLKPGDNAYQIAGEWTVEFLAGGPVLPDSFKIRNLVSWAHSGNAGTDRFAGTARYSIEFRKPDVSTKHWILDLGVVRESARVKINGKEVGSTWSLPFRIPLTDVLVKGKNELEVDVTNLSANRIRDLDRRGVNWKKFYDINFVDVHYQPFDASGWELVDSGLLGPVKLYPAEELVF
jgi:hypothetical protein